MLDEIFQGIYASVVEAQNAIEQHYLGEITEDYFEADGTPKMILVKLPGKDGQLKEVHIPAITLVPHYGLAIDKVSVTMRVKLSSSEDDKEKKGNKVMVKMPALRVVESPSKGRKSLAPEGENKRASYAGWVS